MGSFFPALQQQLPAQALGQTVGAVSAYEQLSDIRNRRQAAAQQAQQKAQRDALLQQLSGRAFGGDMQALQQLVALDPGRAQSVGDVQSGLLKQQETGLGIQETGLGLQQKQLQIQDASIDAQERQRQLALAKNQRARSIFDRVKQDPGNLALYRNAVSAMESQGIIPQGVLDPTTPPTQEGLAEFERDLDLSQAVLQDPRTAEELKGELADIGAVYGIDTDEGRELADRLIRSRIGEREARTRSLLSEDREASVQLPPGLTPIPGFSPGKVEVKEARNVVSGIAPVVATMRALESFINEVGWQAFKTDRAEEGKALASLAQLQLKDALQLGALDAGSERFLRKLLPEDPTQVRQGVVRGNIRRMRNELSNRLRIQTRVRGINADLDQILATGVTQTGPVQSSDITPNIEKAIQRELQEKGFSPRAIDRALGTLKQGVGGGEGPSQSRASVPQIGQMDAALQQIALDDPASFVQQRLDSGVDRADVIRELQQIRQQGATQSPSRREPPARRAGPRAQSTQGAGDFAGENISETSILTIPSVREQLSKMPWVRGIINDPSVLPENEARQVIRDTIEGRGIADAIERAARRLR